MLVTHLRQLAEQFFMTPSFKNNNLLYTVNQNHIVNIYRTEFQKEQDEKGANLGILWSIDPFFFFPRLQV